MTIVMVFAACGANKDAEVISFVAEMDNLTAEIVRAVDEKPAEGVDKAQKLLDARKTELKASFGMLKDLRGYQLSPEATDKFTNALIKDAESIGELQIKYAARTAADEDFAQKLNKLSVDYNSIFEL